MQQRARSQSLHHKKLKSRHRQGFTIIEVLIVLAIAALIMLIIFITIPTLQRNSRNYQRKHAVELAFSATSNYANDHANSLPSSDNPTDPQVVDMVNNYLKPAVTPYTIEYLGNGAPHSYLPDADTIAVQYGHKCNRYGDGDNPKDIIATAGSDSNNHNYVVWTRLEPDRNPNSNDSHISSLAGQAVYCLDNS